MRPKSLVFSDLLVKSLGLVKILLSCTEGSHLQIISHLMLHIQADRLCVPKKEEDLEQYLRVRLIVLSFHLISHRLQPPSCVYYIKMNESNCVDFLLFHKPRAVWYCIEGLGEIKNGHICLGTFIRVSCKIVNCDG